MSEVARQSFFNGETPHIASGIAYTVVFSFLTVITGTISIWSHQWWFLCSWGIGLLLEVVGYSGRIWYTLNDTSRSAYVMELVCITVAPCFLMAGIYNIFAQLVLVYGTQYSYLKPKLYSTIFIICDVLSIFIQGAGGGISSGSRVNSVSTGSNVMIVGLAFQVATMSVFQLLWYSFIVKIIKEKKQFGDSNFNPNFSHVRLRKYSNCFFVAISVSVLLIYVRSIYRLIETAEGWSSKIATKEIYFDILEGLMISLAGLIMCIFSPGFVYGRDAHLKLNNEKAGADGSESYSHPLDDKDLYNERLTI